jgi:hypothetical protein
MLMSVFQRRYGSMGEQRFPFRLSLQWPVKVTRLHVFETHDGLKGHADNCWCRQITTNLEGEQR